MVIIQPFEYEKTTAFKERVQIANKVNEIINLFNELDIERYNNRLVAVENKNNEQDSQITTINNNISSLNNSVIKTSGDQTKSGDLKLTSADSFYLDTTQAWNHLTIRATGQSMGIDMRRRSSDGLVADPCMVLGRHYSTVDTLYGQFCVYSPRTNIGDRSEDLYHVALRLRISKTGVAVVYLTATDENGQEIDKVLGSFNGSTWEN